MYLLVDTQANENQVLVQVFNFIEDSGSSGFLQLLSNGDKI